jgi:hypothetical protein
MVTLITLTNSGWSGKVRRIELDGTPTSVAYGKSAVRMTIFLHEEAADPNPLGAVLPSSLS